MRVSSRKRQTQNSISHHLGLKNPTSEYDELRNASYIGEGKKRLFQDPFWLNTCKAYGCVSHCESRKGREGLRRREHKGFLCL